MNTAGLSRSPLYRLGVGVLFVFLISFGGRPLLAANPSGPLRVEMIAAPNFVVDSNIDTPAGQSPRSAFLGARFWNDGPSNLTEVVAYIGNYNGGVGSTPGLYPRRSHPGLTGPLSGGQFALTHEGGSAGNADAIRYLGTIKPGEYAVVYWLVSYPLMDIYGVPVFLSGPDWTDDLWLTYDVWIQANQGAAAYTAAQTSTATMRNEISAMANKIYPNTANQVPQEYQDLLQQYAPAWTNISADGSVGTRIYTEGIWYQLGNVGMGYDADNDLVFDHDAWLQPVGNPALFDAGVFRLVKTHVMLVVKLKGGGEQVFMDDDHLYWKDLPENNDVVGYVRYEFIPLQSTGRAVLTPYQEAASGANNEKFNADYGAVLGPPIEPTPTKLVLDKSTPVTNAVPGNLIPYTVVFTNTGSVAVGDPTNSLGLMIRDSIPPGTRYVAGSASSSNVAPPGVSGFTILYSTNNGSSWLSSEPVAATNVTDIRWILNGALQPAASATVRFTVQIDPNYSLGPVIVNTAKLSIGDGPPFLEDDARTILSGNNRLGDLVWADDGSGGGMLGNRVQDGAEPGISNVVVTLYYDANTNGLVDLTDLLIGTRISDGSGGYLFTNLFDGPYLAIVNPFDSAVPTGYTLTTPSLYAANLDSAHTNLTGVSFLSADFGFAPALSLVKTPLVAGPVYESRQFTYTLTVTNNLPGNGTAAGTPVRFYAWGSQIDTNNSGNISGNSWVNPENLPNASGPDNIRATGPMRGSPEFVAVTRFGLGTQLGSVTNVKVLVPMVLVTNTAFDAQDSLWVKVLNRANPGTPIYSTQILVSALGPALVNGTLALDVTTNRAWTWGDFGTNLSIQLTTDAKNGAVAKDGVIDADAAGFLITSDQVTAGGLSSTTLDPVPLRDTFDTTLLLYVSAWPAPTSVTTNGITGTIYWRNMGPLYPGAGAGATVTFLGLEPLNNVGTVVTNTAVVTNAFFANGLPANPAVSRAVTNLVPTGVIGDYVWRDQNRDGQQQINEYGIANVKVVLTPPTNVNIGAGMGVPMTNTTDRNGYYIFTGIADTGRYVVAVITTTLPNGGVAVTNTWTEMSGLSSPTNLTVVTNLFPAATNGLDKHLTADFGYAWNGATIDGLVWHDYNRSATSTPDTGEPGLTNVLVYLYSTTNSSVAIATNRTDATGYFRFDGNFDGSYYVVVVTNSGAMTNATWLQTYDTDGLGTSNRVTVTVAPNTVAHADFSYVQLGPYAIGDYVFYDWNGNGVQDATDEGIPNIPVLLYRDVNSNGVVDVGTDVLLSTTNTTVQGYYVFTNRPSGNYLVVVDQSATNFPTSYFVTADPYGAKDGVGWAVVTNASRYDQDFGYQPRGSGQIGDTVWRDLDANGVQAGAEETGITNVTVRLYVDFNGDGTYVLLTSTNTDANGQYLFSNLPDGQYKVVVDTASAALPKDSFGLPYAPTTPTNVLATISGGNSILTADFGFSALGAIGDTVFWDSNANGTQDWNEYGITNVTMRLYVDANSNGVYDAGTDTLYGTRVTDTNGMYIFTGLPAGDYVIVVDTNSAPLLGSRLTAAPALDGAPLTNAALQSVYSQYGVSIQPGVSFLGADFGFQGPGVIGETVWIDTNGNGVRDGTEVGIANVPLVLSNATTSVTNRTDVDGYYNFTGVLDGTYWVRVLTNDAAFPYGLRPTYDPDGTNTANLATSIVVSNGHVVSVGGTVRTNFDLMINFGYQYGGTYALSGTVGLDGTPLNGVMGTGISGVSSDEVAFAGQTVNLYVWRDANSNGAIEVSERTFIGSTQTATNGDYSFTGLPASFGSGTNYYIVSLAAPDTHLALTTVTGSTPALWVTQTTNAFGENLSAYQVTAIAPNVTNIDFAYRSTWLHDFGDLPSSYSTLLNDAPEGARHRVLTVPDLYLGAGVSTEKDGQPSVTASLDTYDDGVTTTGCWRNTTSGAVVTVTVGKGDGWLVGYIDYNHDGDFLDANEMVMSQAVATNGGNGSGVYTFNLTVPSGAVLSTTTSTFYARFRLFPDEPAFPDLAFSGLANDGEVEDYRWDFGAVGDTVWIDSNGNNVRDGGEPGIANVRVFADLDSNGVWSASEPYATTDASGRYGIGGFPAGSFSIVVDTNTLPAGLTATYDADGAPLGQAAVTLAAGQVNTNVDFAYVVLTSISGSVRFDVNGNGAIDPPDTNGIAGVTVQLLDANSNVVATTTTSATGAYFFENLPPGSYIVREVDPAGYESTLDTQGANDNLIAVTLTSGTPSTGNDFYDTIRYAAVGDFVWEDMNGNGAQDAGEPGMSNLTVRLLNASSNVVASTTTGTNGYYRFDGVVPGTYLIEVVKPANAVFTIRHASITNDLADSDVFPATSRTATLVLGNSETNLNQDAGLYVPGRIRGYAFMDDVPDLVRVQGQDSPVTNMLVWLMLNGTAIATNRTDGNGYYQFASLSPGDYTVVFDCNTNSLIAVPTNGPAATDPERNRAQTTGTSDGYIHHTLVSGEGVLPERPGEPLNAGFDGPPLAAAIDVVAYAGANGPVVEFTTYEEAGTHDIVLYAWLGGEWVEIGRQEAVGEGSNRYTFDALPMLRSGQRYDFRIVDDEGRPHNVAGLEVAAFRAKAVRMVKDGVWIEFASLPDRTYDVYRSSSPAAPDGAWTLVGTVTAIERTTRTVVPVDPAARQGFFRVKMR